MNERSGAPSWSVFEGWRAPVRTINWAAAREWSESFDRHVEASKRSLAEAVTRWDERLSAFGGRDPARTDWSRFRPLRLSREEDWSDWLAHLLEASDTGRFAARLFARDLSNAVHWSVKRVDRELVADEFRADLVVHFHGDEWLHVEVKVGDLELAKTAATASALGRHVVGRRRRDFILLPEEDTKHWESERKRAPQDGIELLTWHDVAAALRRSIAEPGEAVEWRIWAMTFTGAVEQHILGFPPVQDVTWSLAPGGALARLEYLEKLETNDDNRA